MCPCCSKKGARGPKPRASQSISGRDRGGWPTGARMHAQQGNKIVGDTTVGARNVISRNEHGFVIYGAGATGNRVMQNVISRNDETGVAVSDDGAKGNRILSNSVFANGLLGIDLGAD